LSLRHTPTSQKGGSVSLLYIILIIVLVLLLLGFFSRGRW
jgi:flagellar basal body-associated protein FliL